MSAEVSCASSGSLKMRRISSGDSATTVPDPGELATSCAWASTRPPAAPGRAGATSSARRARAPARRTRRDDRIRSRRRRASVRPRATRPATRPAPPRTSAMRRGGRRGASLARHGPYRPAAGNVTGNWPPVTSCTSLNVSGPGRERLVEGAALDLAEDAERVRSGGGREEHRLVPARLAEARLEREVARLVAEGDRCLERLLETLDRLLAMDGAELEPALLARCRPARR